MVVEKRQEYPVFARSLTKESPPTIHPNFNNSTYLLRIQADRDGDPHKAPVRCAPSSSTSRPLIKTHSDFGKEQKALRDRLKQERKALQ